MLWNTFAAGHEAPTGTSKRNYHAETDRGGFYIDCCFSPRGRFLGYQIRATNTKGCFPADAHTGLWHDLGKHPTLKGAKRIAKAFYDRCQAQQPA